MYSQLCVESQTISVKSSKLVAYNFGIRSSEEVVADRAPGIVDADFHSALTRISPIYQAQLTIRAVRKVCSRGI